MMEKYLIKKKTNYVKKTIVEIAIVVLFVVSLGTGEFISLGPLKLSYFTTLLFFLYTVFFRKKRSVVLSNKKRLAFIFFVVWLLYGFFQVLWAKDLQLWMMFYRTLLLNIVTIILIFNYVETLDDWKTVCLGFKILIILMLLIGLWEHLTSKHLEYVDFTNMNQETAALDRYRPMSFFGNVNDHATVLFLGACIFILSFFLNHKGIHRKISFVFIISFILIEIYWTDSRAVLWSFPLLLMLMIMFYLIGIMTNWNSKKNKNVVLVLTVLFILFISFALLINDVDYYVQLVSKGGYTYSDMFRLKIIKDGLAEFVETGGFGLGPGQSITINGINLHFFYLEILIEYGLLIGLVFFYVMFKLLFDSMDKEHFASDCLIKSFPVVLLVAGISSSKMFSLKLFWVSFALVFLFKYCVFPAKNKG